VAEEALMRRHTRGQDTLGAVAVPPLGAAFDLAVTHLERGADVVGLQLGHRPPLPLGVSKLRWRSRPVTITRSPLPRESARWLLISQNVGCGAVQR
jgi:hypothetical protein